MSILINFPARKIYPEALDFADWFSLHKQKFFNCNFIELCIKEYNVEAITLFYSIFCLLPSNILKFSFIIDLIYFPQIKHLFPPSVYQRKLEKSVVVKTLINIQQLRLLRLLFYLLLPHRRISIVCLFWGKIQHNTYS